MICINAEQLQDGLYNIKDGKIYKYKAKGGTVRTYELRNIVRCGECKYWEESQYYSEFMVCTYVKGATFTRQHDDFCSRGERSSDEID